MYFQRVIILLGLLPLAVAAAENKQMAWDGNFRTGYYGSDTQNRDGTDKSSRSGRARIRYGFKAPFSDRWSSQLRFAGRYSTSQKSTGFTFAEYNNALGTFGQSTFDIAQLRYRTQDLDIRFGRMQTKFELEGVAKKSLDRNDSPNMDIDFTDGIAITRKGNSGWDSHFILQHNPAQGSSAGLHCPGCRCHRIYRAGEKGQVRFLAPARRGSDLHTECPALRWYQPCQLSWSGGAWGAAMAPGWRQ